MRGDGDDQREDDRERKRNAQQGLRDQHHVSAERNLVAVTKMHCAGAFVDEDKAERNQRVDGSCGG